MRKVIFLSLLTFVLLKANAQVQTQVTGDSVFIHSNTGTGELILQNSTDTVNGFLFNKGNGRTQFRRGLVQIDDSTYLIGADTLHTRSFGSLLFPGPQYSIVRSNGDGTATADHNMSFYPNFGFGELYFQNESGNSFSDLYVDNTPRNSAIDIESLSGWGLSYYYGASAFRGDNRTTLALAPDSAATSGIQVQDYNSGNTVGIYPSSIVSDSLSTPPSSPEGLKSIGLGSPIITSNMYNLILPPTSGADGQVLGRVSKTGNDVILDWMNAGTGSSGTLQNAFDAAPMASPQINAHGNDFFIDSVQNFLVVKHIDSNAIAAIDSKGGFRLYYNDDTSYSGITSYQNANLTANLHGSDRYLQQQLSVTPTASIFSGINSSYNSESKVVFQNTDTLLSAPPYIAAFDGDTLKKYSFISAIGGVPIPGSQGNVVRSNGDGFAIADQNMSFYPGSTYGELYFQNESGNSYGDIYVDDESLHSRIDIETLSGWGLRYYSGAARGDSRTTLALDPDSANTSGILLQDYNSGNTVGIYPSVTAGNVFARKTKSKNLKANALDGGSDNIYNLILPPASGADGQVLGRVAQTGTDVILDWINPDSSEANRSSTLQNAFDAAPTASPQINAHGNDIELDSANLYQNSYNGSNYTNISSNADPSKKPFGTSFIVGNDSVESLIQQNIDPIQTVINVQNGNTQNSQRLTINSDAITFQGSKTGIPNARIIFEAIDTLTSAPPYIAAFDGDTLKKYPYLGLVGSSTIPGSQFNVVRSNGDGTAMADQNMGFYPGLTNGELYFQNPSGTSYNVINVDDRPGSAIDIESLSGWGLKYFNGAAIGDNRTTLALNPDSANTSGIQVQDYNTGNTVGIYPSAAVLDAPTRLASKNEKTNGLSLPPNVYNLILPLTNGADGQLLGRVSQTGKDVTLGWMDAGAGTSLTLQNAIDNGGDISSEDNNIIVGDGTHYLSFINNLGSEQLLIYPNHFYSFGDDGQSYGMGFLTSSKGNDTVTTLSGGGGNLRILTNPSSGVPDSVYGVNSDRSVHLYPFSQGSSGTVTGIATGYGLSGGIITTTGTIGVDSSALHLKFLGIADSTIYYPFKSNPKNYLTSSNAWGTTGNAGTTGGTSFIGTTDNVPLNFRVNNALVGTIGTSSNYNVSFGALSLPNTSTGIKNGAIGGGALGKNTTGFNNFAIGYTTLYNNLTGSNNTANGWAVMGYDSAAVGNTAMGAGAMGQTGSTLHIGGSYNSAVGYDALLDNFNNKYNIGIGYYAGNASASSNTFYISDSTYHMKYKLDSSSGNAPSVIGKDANGFWHVYQAPAAGSATYTASNGLTMTSNNTQLGGSLLQSTTINASAYQLAMTGSDPTLDGVFKVTASGGGTGVDGQTSDGVGVVGKANGTGIGVYASSNNVALSAICGSTGIPGLFAIQPVNPSTTFPALQLGINPIATSPNGMGTSIDFTVNRTTRPTFIGNQLISKWTTAAEASRTTEFSITGVNNTVTATLFTLSGNGSLKLNKYGIGAFTGTPTYNLSVDASGNILETSSGGSGTATLAAGTVTVSTTLVKAGAKIFVSVNTPGGTQGFLSASAVNIVNGTSFKINSTSVTETSTVNWQIIN